jgi:hypothetical protein
MRAQQFVRTVVGEHVKSDSLARMIATLNAFGFVTPSPNGRTFTIKSHRKVSHYNLMRELRSWERYGFAHWEVVARSRAEPQNRVTFAPANRFRRPGNWV